MLPWSILYWSAEWQNDGLPSISWLNYAVERDVKSYLHTTTSTKVSVMWGWRNWLKRVDLHFTRSSFSALFCWALPSKIWKMERNARIIFLHPGRFSIRSVMSLTPWQVVDIAIYFILLWSKHEKSKNRICRNFSSFYYSEYAYVHYVYSIVLGSFNNTSLHIVVSMTVRMRRKASDFFYISFLNFRGCRFSWWLVVPVYFLLYSLNSKDFTDVPCRPSGTQGLRMIIDTTHLPAN